MLLAFSRRLLQSQRAIGKASLSSSVCGTCLKSNSRSIHVNSVDFRQPRVFAVASSTRVSSSLVSIAAMSTKSVNNKNNSSQQQQQRIPSSRKTKTPPSNSPNAPPTSLAALSAAVVSNNNNTNNTDPNNISTVKSKRKQEDEDPTPQFSCVIVGRPNVGKSAIFNRLTQSDTAIVHDMPGVTRDRQTSKAYLGSLCFYLTDTAGLDDTIDGAPPPSPSTPSEPLLQELLAYALTATWEAVERADVVLFVIDAKHGITPLDQYFARKLHTKGKPTILIANKAEGARMELDDARSLGFGQPVPFSALHAEGLGDLFSLLFPFSAGGGMPLPQDPESNAPTFAIFGRPNVGKSSLVNALTEGAAGRLVGPEAGVTRDAVLIPFDFNGEPFQIVDTAGIRRRPRVEDVLEKKTVANSMKMLQKASVCVLLLDGETRGVMTKQDKQLAAQAIAHGRCVLIAINKIDLLEPDEREETIDDLRKRFEKSFPQVGAVPVIGVSAHSRENLTALMDGVKALHKKWSNRIKTNQINQWVSDLRRLQPTLSPLLLFATQAEHSPPLFVCFSRAKRGANALGGGMREIPQSVKNMIANSMRERFKLDGVPLKFVFRATGKSKDDQESNSHIYKNKTK